MPKNVIKEVREAIEKEEFTLGLNHVIKYQTFLKQEVSCIEGQEMNSIELVDHAPEKIKSEETQFKKDLPKRIDNLLLLLSNIRGGNLENVEKALKERKTEAYDNNLEGYHYGEYIVAEHILIMIGMLKKFFSEKMIGDEALKRFEVSSEDKMNPQQLGYRIHEIEGLKTCIKRIKNPSYGLRD